MTAHPCAFGSSGICQRIRVNLPFRFGFKWSIFIKVRLKIPVLFNYHR